MYVVVFSQFSIFRVTSEEPPQVLVLGPVNGD